MSSPIDFIIYGSTDFPGISLILPRTGDAYDFIVEQGDLTVMDDGSAPIPSNLIPEFIEDAAWSKLTCQVR
tara:strand:+ start:709 stop:921 length:213 start_codon:yes stop_codon:yes gene_type:complete